jgi:hypothetical protein
MSNLSSTSVKAKEAQPFEFWLNDFFELPHSHALRQKPSYLPYPLKQLYYSQLKHWQAYFREAIDNILIADPSLTIPVSFKPFERYLSGFEIEYYGFDNTFLPSVHGCHTIEDGKIKIYYASNCPQTRKRFSVAHEFIHIYQRLDPHFRSSMEALPSDEVRAKLIERIAENIASYYLVPQPLLENCYKTDKDVYSLASTFCVSQKTMEICLKEYRLTWVVNDLDSFNW